MGIVSEEYPNDTILQKLKRFAARHGREVKVAETNGRIVGAQVLVEEVSTEKLQEDWRVFDRE